MLLSTGCANRSDPPPQIIKEVVYKSPIIAPELLTCKALPVVPKVTMQSEVAIYVVELFETASECYGNLGMVKAVLESEPP